MGKGFEGNPCEELLRALVLEKRKIRRDLIPYTAGYRRSPFLRGREEGQTVISSLC